MRTLIALAAVATLSLTGAAFAQSSNAPNGAPAGTGANTGTTPGAPNNNVEPGGATKAQNGMNGEGRAAAPDATTPGDAANPAPTTTRGDQNGQGVAK